MSGRVHKSRSQHHVMSGTAIGARERAVHNRWVKQLVALLLLGTGLSIVHVWSRVQVLRIRYNITTVQNRVTQLAKDVRQMETQISALQSAERLTAFANESLNLQLPRPEQVMVVRGAHAQRVSP
jgi:cell division protein FtsL